jgi:hypothetical protein
MSIETIQRGVEREEEDLQEQLSAGVITVKEYNDALRQLHREAREYAREEAQDCQEKYYHN